MAAPLVYQMDTPHHLSQPMRYPARRNVPSVAHHTILHRHSCDDHDVTLHDKVVQDSHARQGRFQRVHVPHPYLRSFQLLCA